MRRLSHRFFSYVLGTKIGVTAGLSVTAILLALSQPQVAYAQAALFSNLDTPVSNVGGTGSNITVGGTQKAVAFTTGGGAYNLSSIEAYLSLDNGQTGTSVLSLSLYTPSTVGGSDPGALAVSLGTANVSNSITTPMLYTFTPSSAFTFAANTRYVLLVDYVSGSNGNWNQGNPNTAPTARNNSGFSTATYRASQNNGASYTNSGTLNLFAINGTAAAPEPGSVSFLVLGIVGGAGTLRGVRRRSSTKHGG